ncbi:MAG: L-threonylcarbamoyladenylate synthase [Treponema sp.]|nr:L-threonylcarbamoyladenylate synthase [Treponema sp.]
MICRKCDEESVHIAADYLRRGKVVVLPTDTVYGFSGIVDGRHYSFHTDKEIARLKGTDPNKPLIQLLSRPEDLKKYTRDLVPDFLLEKWPGPLTIIVHTLAKGGEFTTTAFRCPDDEWLRKIVALCGAPIYSTSVNKTGNPVLDNISQIKSEFGRDVPLIIDDGDMKGGVPSTIVRIDERGEVEVVREGSLKIK